MVQRKDSLCYVEFIRGKYMLQNRGYIMKLLSNMTEAERSRVASGRFDDLWYGFWQTNLNRSFMKEYEQSKSRFDTLLSGYYLRVSDSSDVPPVFFDLATAIAGTQARHDEPEWGFPKGRRNINESDIRCACREFHEETGVELDHIRVLGGVKPFEEVFRGSNRIRYRHVYYLAGACHPALAEGASPPPIEEVAQREISNVGWYDFEGVAERIRPENVERLEMFKRVHAMVLARHAARPLSPVFPPPTTATSQQQQQSSQAVVHGSDGALVVVHRVAAGPEEPPSDDEQEHNGE